MPKYKRCERPRASKSTEEKEGMGRKVPPLGRAPCRAWALPLQFPPLWKGTYTSASWREEIRTCCEPPLSGPPIREIQPMPADLGVTFLRAEETGGGQHWAFLVHPLMPSGMMPLGSLFTFPCSDEKLDLVLCFGRWCWGCQGGGKNPQSIT